MKMLGAFYVFFTESKIKSTHMRKYLIYVYKTNKSDIIEI